MTHDLKPLQDEVHAFAFKRACESGLVTHPAQLKLTLSIRSYAQNKDIKEKDWDVLFRNSGNILRDYELELLRRIYANGGPIEIAKEFIYCGYDGMATRVRQVSPVLFLSRKKITGHHVQHFLT